MSGEAVVKETRLHQIIYLPAATLLAVAILLFAVVHAQGDAASKEYIFPQVLTALALVAAIPPFVRRSSSEFVVTNKRVLVKTGFVRRHSTEILLRQVEGITVDQGILGRMLGFGTIVVEGTGSDRTPYKGIASPMEFRLAVQEQIEANANPGYATAPLQQQPAKEDRYAMLLRLNELKEKGVLTDEEFGKEKTRILQSQ
jgi:membrane protein YdbS with pleckstrin-like domain